MVPASAKQAAMGRQLDPEAFVVHRGYIPTMVIVVLDDPLDPTPYWLISTRDPEGPAAALPDLARRYGARVMLENRDCLAALSDA